METQNIALHSVWGKWWEPIRKWFYPAWLLYELTYRFYGYSIATYNYIEEVSNELLAIVSGVATFLICTAFLTVSTCFVLCKFFKIGNLTGTSFEERIKKYF